ncbi:MAG: polyphosphate kinase 1 [Planctomycetaceae bacterium]|nr:polyphosphate kinase 1 [Planctomycetaceae bacterium]
MDDRQTKRFVNRELSWLEFNQRVLDEACDTNTPLLERLKFLAITDSNLDEFFMVRVGGLQILAEQGATKTDPTGMTPAEQLVAIHERASRMTADQYACFMDDIEPALAEHGIQRLRPDDMSERQSKAAAQVFLSDIYPILSPIATTSADDFPRLVNHTLNVCTRLAPVDGESEPRFAVIPFGVSARRFVTLYADGGYAYTLLEDAVDMFADRFFPGEVVEECVPFRITRNADIAVRDDTASDLLADMRDLLDARKRSDCVRLQIAEEASDETLAFLQETLEVVDEDVHRLPGPLALSDFMKLTDLNGFDALKREPWPPQPPPEINPSMSMFDVISQRDVLLCHPYDSFDPVVRLIEEAAGDPDVLAIKQTLYRTSRNSPIVRALARAAQLGKYVTVIVELKARFDEARNIEWARHLEQADVQVIYGVKGLKTHAKMCLIVRREPHGVRRYLHIGTGNYNEATARIYSDICLMTCDDELGADATTFFNAITGYSQPKRYRKLAAAPTGLRDRLLEMIEAETKRKQQGQKAHIVAKVNSLVDPKIINALYAASQAGVTVKLNIRGICCLRPGVSGLSENIEAVSIIDRFLEHARIFYFYHGGDERVFISSADWMPRSLDRRVELLTPVEDIACQRRLIMILDTYFRDTRRARKLLPDGGYQAAQYEGEGVSSQEVLYREACEAVKAAKQSHPTMFEPHRALK